MSEPSIPSPEPGHPGPASRRTRIHRTGAAGARPPRWRGRIGLAAAALLLATTTLGCTEAEPAGSGAAKRAGAEPAAVGVTGPLCPALPAGTDPGNPASLAGLPGDEALKWLPVLTRFEAAVRAAGVSAELRAPQGVTILAPTDDAFAKKFSEDNIDELMIHRRDELRTLLRAHLVTGSHSLAELVGAGTAGTFGGTSVTVTAADPMARLDDRAETVCADYRIAGGRIHIINGVLGNLPTTADGDGDRAH